MQIAVEMRIDAPRERVFGLAMEPNRWPDYIKAIKSIEVLTPGPVKVGTRFRETRVMFGREATEEMTFAEIVPPEKLVLTAESHGTKYHVEERFTAEAGGTRITMNFTGTPVTLMARLMSPLASMMAGKVKEQLAADLADIKREAEAVVRPS